jgi:hypothetical protein
MRKGIERIAVVTALSVLALAHTPAVGAPAPTRSYVWFGQFEALDENARVATFKGQVAEHIPKYLQKFKPGDQIVLVWDMIRKTQADRVLAVWNAEELKSTALRSGYILPARFVSADADGRTVTFTTVVPDKGLSTLKSSRAGQWLKVTAPMEQPGDQAVITAIEASEKPQPAEAPPPAGPAEATAKPSAPAAPQTPERR